MKQLLIIGARGFGREVYDLAMDCIEAGADFEVKGFLDDKMDALDGYKNYPPIISSVEEYNPQQDDVFVCGLGQPEWRKYYIDMVLAKGGKFVTLVGPKAIVRRNVEIGEGCLITNFSTLSVDTIIGNYACIIRSFIGHDAKVGEYSVLSGGVALNGYCEVGNEAYIGSQATIAPHKKIGYQSFVGIGSVVIRDVKDGVKVFGNPAKKIVI